MIHNLPGRFPMEAMKMQAMKVGIREFRTGLADFIGANAPVAITRHGQTVGYFIPAHGHDEAELAALKRASRTLDDLLARHEVDTEAVAAQFKQARKRGAPDERQGAGH
jgi:antitoxin (DNA-binding transcriptional repressor) of toxin-antitoxin stability system